MGSGSELIVRDACHRRNGKRRSTKQLARKFRGIYWMSFCLPRKQAARNRIGSQSGANGYVVLVLVLALVLAREWVLDQVTNKAKIKPPLPLSLNIRKTDKMKLTLLIMFNRS